MKKHLAVTIVMISCVLMLELSSCSLITNDKDRFTLDKNDYITMIDLDKTGPNVVVPEKLI